MRRVAVFGNAGGGKSALAKQLSEITGLPLYVLDIVQFSDGRYRRELRDGGKLSDEEFARLHGDIVARDEWIIDGFGNVALS